MMLNHERKGKRIESHSHDRTLQVGNEGGQLGKDPIENRGVIVRDARQQTVGGDLSVRSLGSEGRKRNRESFQSSRDKSNSRPCIPSRDPVVSFGPRGVCHKCGQVGHYRSHCVKSPRTCYLCGGFGHIASKCTQKVSVSSRGLCHKCGQSGHLRSQCPRRLKSCHRCGQLGHLVRNCPQGARASSESSSVQSSGSGQSVNQQQGHGSTQGQSTSGMVDVVATIIPPPPISSQHSGTSRGTLYLLFFQVEGCFDYKAFLSFKSRPLSKS